MEKYTLFAFKLFARHQERKEVFVVHLLYTKTQQKLLRFVLVCRYTQLMSHITSEYLSTNVPKFIIFTQRLVQLIRGAQVPIAWEGPGTNLMDDIVGCLQLTS